MEGTLGILAIIVVSILWIRLDSHRRKKKIDLAFLGREPLSPEQFYERHYKDKGIPLPVIQGVRKVLEEELSADMSRLLSSDDFSRNIGFFFQFDSMADVSIVCALETHFSISISDDEASNTKTIDDIINLVWNKLPAQHTNEKERQTQ